MTRKRYDITEHGPRSTKTMPQFEGYTVGQWCPTPDGTGPPMAVVLAIDFNQTLVIGFDTGHIHSCKSIALRLQSRHAINTLITILERHRDEVFPLTKG